MKTPYIGRFAPSPSGPLHFGSLVTALGSYLQARANAGQWLVRIEDLDPPREQPGAAALILEQLQAFGMQWDGPVRYQSQQHAKYQAQIDLWLESGKAYYCQCTRKQIQVQGGIYQGTCRHLNLNGSGCAIRLISDSAPLSYHDCRRGEVNIPAQLAGEDMIIRRRDGLYAYNLAVVLDDIDQGVTEIVRGADLLEPTGRQCAIYQVLGANEPSYLHLPLALDSNGRKLSKQNHATAIDVTHRQALLHQAFAFLGHPVPPSWQLLAPQQLLQAMTTHWNIEQLPINNSVIASEGFSFGHS